MDIWHKEMLLSNGKELIMKHCTSPPMGVIVTGNNNTNNLGVVRNLGRNGVPVMLLVLNNNGGIQHSRYIAKKLFFSDLDRHKASLIDYLINLGERSDEKYLIIPTSDLEVTLLSMRKHDLERYYYLLLPQFEVVQNFVNKRMFYKLLDQMSIPHPRTYFPRDPADLSSVKDIINFPYIIKPACSYKFQSYFNTKTFVINSSEDLSQAIKKLSDKDLDVVVQEIIPGNDIYMFYTYFNKYSKPLGICGYDKLRQNPPDFGSGSLCKCVWRSNPIGSSIRLLKKIGYYGFAEPEFKRDPRDGIYKLIEINARTTTQSGLAAKCGVNVEYISYLDAIGEFDGACVTPKSEMLWVDEFGDFVSCLNQLKDGRLNLRDIAKSFKGDKVFAWASWDDPMPFLMTFFMNNIDYVKRHFKY